MIRFAVLDELAGLVTPQVGRVLYRLAGDVPADQAIVELGSYKGKSTCYLAAGALHGKGAHVWAVDAWELPGNDTGRHGYADPQTKAAFSRQVTSLGLADRVTAVQAFTRDAAAMWDAGKVGLLFVDASHLYEDVLADFSSWEPFLADGATVVFDDYATKKNPGVQQAVDELITDRRLFALDVSCPPLAITTWSAA